MTTRRDVLKYLSGVSLSLFVEPFFHLAFANSKSENSQDSWETRGFVMGSGAKEKRLHADQLCPCVGAPGNIIAGNFSGTKFKSIPTQFLPHQIVQNSKNPNQLFAFHKWGEHGIEVSLSSEKTRALALPKDHYFYGHAVMSPDGEHIIAGAMDQARNVGVLLSYHTKTLKLENIQLTYGVHPHDMQLSADQKHLLVANSGTTPKFRKKLKPKEDITLISNMARIDLASGKLVEQIIMDHGDKMYAHFVMVAEHNFICFGLTGAQEGSEQLPSAMATIKGTAVTDLMSNPIVASAIGEALSARKTSDGKKVIVTLPMTNAMAILDISGQPLKMIHNIEAPKSLFYSPDSSLLMVSQLGGPMKAYSVNNDSLSSLDGVANIKGTSASKWFGTGSHATEIIWPT